MLKCIYGTIAMTQDRLALIIPQLHNLTRVVLAMFLFLPLIVAAQGAESTQLVETQPLFSSHSVLNIRIKAPLTQLMRERSNEHYLDGTLSYTDASGVVHTLDLKLRTRGEYRRQRKTCSFAPLRLNFRKKQVAETVFAGQDKLKLVTHCKTNSNRYEQLVLKEYLAYRSLQILTENSFDTRLLRVTYVNSEDEGKSITRFGFVIEDEKGVGDRVRLSPAKVPKIAYEDLDRQQASLVSLFQYMIGNTDFSLIRGALDDNCCHNIELFSNDDDVYTPIPYDFDFAGMVNAPYAEPNPKLKINSVRVHYFRGRCSENELLNDTAAYIREHETEIRNLVANQDDLEDGHQKDVIRYLNVFFERIATPQNVERYFARKCS